VGEYLIGQGAETEILWDIFDRRVKRNINILGVYLIRRATERVILWGYI